MAFFSIIVPVYKVEKYLEQCVESVLAQSYKDYELILVNDGSPDSCPEKCDKYAKKDKRVHVIHKMNEGASAARNCGIEYATGDYVMFLDADDFWDDTDALLKIYQFCLSKNKDVIVINSKKYFQLDKKYSVPTNLDLTKYSNCFGDVERIEFLMKNNLFVACAWDKVIKKELIDNFNLRFVMGQVGEDIEWCVKLLIHLKTIEYVNESFYVYRQQNASSVTSNIGVKNISDISQIIVKYAHTSTGNSDVDLIIKNYLAQQYVLWITITNLVKESEIQPLVSEMKKYWNLLKYDWYPYVKKVSRVKWLGYRGVKFLLCVYRKIKRG